jgi:hypothetical protein
MPRPSTFCSGLGLASAPDLGWWLLSGLPFALSAGVLTTGRKRWVALAFVVVAVAASLRMLDSRADSQVAVGSLAVFAAVDVVGADLAEQVVAAFMREGRPERRLFSPVSSWTPIDVRPCRYKRSSWRPQVPELTAWTGPGWSTQTARHRHPRTSCRAARLRRTAANQGARRAVQQAAASRDALPAAAATAPFLLHLAADPTLPDRAGVVGLVAHLVVGYDEEWLPGTIPIARIRARLPADGLVGQDSASHHALEAMAEDIRRHNAKVEPTEQLREPKRAGATQRAKPATASEDGAGPPRTNSHHPHTRAQFSSRPWSNRVAPRGRDSTKG